MIGKYQRAFYGGQYASMAPLFAGMIGSALALASAILLSVPPHPRQDVSLVNIVAESDCPFPPCTAD